MKHFAILSLMIVLFGTTGCLYRPKSLEGLLDDKYAVKGEETYREVNSVPFVGPYASVRAHQKNNETTVTSSYYWPLYLGKERHQIRYNSDGKSNGFTDTSWVLFGLPWRISESTMYGPNQDIHIRDTRLFFGLLARDVAKTSKASGKLRKEHKAHLGLGILACTREVSEFPNGVETLVEQDVKLLAWGLFGHGRDKKGTYTRWLWFYKHYSDSEI